MNPQAEEQFQKSLARMQMKITIAALAIVTSLVMLGLVSYAWMNLSTSPEISGIILKMRANGVVYLSSNSYTKGGTTQGVNRSENQSSLALCSFWEGMTFEEIPDAAYRTYVQGEYGGTAAPVAHGLIPAGENVPTATAVQAYSMAQEYLNYAADDNCVIEVNHTRMVSDSMDDSLSFLTERVGYDVFACTPTLYESSVDLSRQVAGYSELIPVSTADGVNWYRPTFNPDGSLMPASLFEHDDSLRWANYTTDTELIAASYPHISGLTGDEKTAQSLYQQNSNRTSGYYVYADVWVKATSDCTLSLTVPESDSWVDMYSGQSNASDLLDYQQNYEGTYVMAVPKFTDENAAPVRNSGAEECMRVGFLTGDGFTIYEPNAFSHTESSFVDETNRNNLQFEAGQTADSLSNITKNNKTGYRALNGYYLPTYPIYRKADGSSAVLPAAELSSYLSRVMVQAGSGWRYHGAPLFDEDGLFAGKNAEGNAMSAAELSAFRTKFVADIAQGKASSYVDKGSFVKDDFSETYNQSLIPNASGTTVEERYASQVDEAGYLAPRSAVNICSMEEGEEKCIRLIFWIEGQDVDCWNDVTSNNLIVNLEITAEPAEEGGESAS